jgi:alpha-beta hydrolase superfamily lysophospholipase
MTAIYIFAALLIIYLLIGFSATLYILCPPKVSLKKKAWELFELKQVDPKIMELPFETIEKTSPWGYKLYARKYCVPDSNKYVILLHGHNSDSSAMVRFAPLFLERGINCIIPDHRFSALSGGGCITLGHKESKDAAVFIDYIHEINKDAKIGIFGESMGAATALLLSSNRTDLSFTVEYCGYSDLSSLIKHNLKSIWKPLIIIYPLFLIFVPLFIHTRIKNVSPAFASKTIRCPVLLMHSKADKVVPYENSIKIKENINGATLVSFENAQHGLSLNTYPKQFSEAINSFLDSIPF